MNNNKINSLYELIKQKSKEKGRKLKVICDWDECLQPGKPWLLYKSSGKGKNIDFKNEYFEKFWESEFIKFKSMKKYNEESKVGLEQSLGVDKSKLKNTPIQNSVDEDIINILDNYSLLKKKEKKDLADNITARYHRPWLSIVEELILAWKEGYIEKCALLTSFIKGKHPSTGNPGKVGKFAETFGKIPVFEFKPYEMTPPKSLDRPFPIWKWTKENYPDFDIFIDDNPNRHIVQKEHFPDRTYVVPDYKPNRHIQAPNIYHVKTTVSDLKDQDFAIAALEKKLEQLEQAIKQETEIKNRSYFWLILFFFLTILFTSGGLILIKVFKKKQQRWF